MSKQCPNCGSYNTDPIIINYVGRGLLHAGRAALALGAHAVGGLINPSTGAASGHTVWKNTEPGPLKSHKCNNCGHIFAP